MAIRRQVDDILLMLSVQLAQPGVLGDVVLAYERLSPSDASDGDDGPEKADVRARLEHLVAVKFVWLYVGRRYMLTRAGERYVGLSGLQNQIDSRRLYLLKETRRSSLAVRSDARDGPLKQRS